MTERLRRLLGALLLAAVTGPAVALTPLEIQGKELYFGATGRPLKAYLAGSSEPVDAAAVPCAGCHGEDGRGRSEGGIVPGDITWSSLTKPYGHSHGAYRKHPAFHERSLAAALARGIDPAGNALDPVMPRYVLGRNDLAALTAYLKRIEADPPAGVAAGRLRLGVVLPLAGPQEPAGRDLLALLSTYVEELNGRGGIYNRRLELVIAEAAADRRQTLANVRRLISVTPVLAVIAALVPAHEAAVAETLDRSDVPLIGAVADFPAAGARNGFYLAEGLPERLLALLDRISAGGSGSPPGEHRDEATRLPDRPRLAVVHPAGTDYRPLLEALDAAAADKGWPRPQRWQNVADSAESVADAVIFIGSETELAAWIAARPAVALPPYLFLPVGAAAGDALFDLPGAVADRLLIAVPFPPIDPAGGRSSELSGWQRRAGIGDRSRYAEMLGLGAIQVLTEGIKRAGADVSRRKLVAALEELRQFDAAPLPSLGFTPARHIGRSGTAWIAIERERRRFREIDGAGGTP